MTAISEPDTMALAATGVTKHYDSGFVLDDVTFDLPKGYIMGLIGPNGAGKSTLIKLILNMIRRDHGSIQVLGLDNIIDEEAVKEQLGVVFDSSYLYEQWKVSKVERIVAPLYPAWNGERYRRYLDDFGLGGAQNGKKKIKDLSRGMQMKLMLAIALSHDAKLLILDEPTSGLDVLARDELMDMLHAYIEDGEHSVLFSTHITVDLERAADFITYITGGRLYYTGPKDEFEESFRIVKGGPDELAQLPAGVVLGSHTYQTGFDALVRSDSLGTVSAAVADIVVEPTSGLDVLARDELMDMLHAYIEDGEHSVLFSTHITVDLERAADFITYITGGRLYYTGPKDEFEESFRIVKGGPDELAQLPAGVVLGSHTYQTGFDALVRSDSLGTVSAAVADIVVEPASIDDIIRLTNVRDSVASSPEAASALKEVGHGNVD